MGKFAVFDPEARRPAGEIAGDGIETKAHHLGHVQTARRRTHDLLRRSGARLTDEIRSRHADSAARAACRAGGRASTELAPAVAVAQIRLQHSAIDHAVDAAAQAFTVERPRAGSTRAK